MGQRVPSYRGYRFPAEIIGHAVWLYHRFSLSFRDVEDLLVERGIIVTYETIRQLCLTFGLEYARRLRTQRGRQGGTWYLDEVFVRIQGRQQYLWRAVDEDGDALDILVQSRRNRRAAVRFFRNLLKDQGGTPRQIVTDKLPSYPAAKRTMPSVPHVTAQYANNRAEVSHQPTRQREAPDAALQVCRSAATLRVGPRRRAESLSGRAPLAAGRSPPVAPHTRNSPTGKRLSLLKPSQPGPFADEVCAVIVKLTRPPVGFDEHLDTHIGC